VNRLVLATLLGAFSVLLGACVTGDHAGSGYPPRPDIVIVRPFEVPESVVILDPSFGFSLRRGAPGVPRAERAAAVGRAAAFALADALIEDLKAAGLDAVPASSAAPVPEAKILIISGTFGEIDQGLRRSVGRVAPGAGQSRVVADARIDYELSGSTQKQLLTVHADSAEIAADKTSEPLTSIGSQLQIADANADAARVGRAIGQAIVELAHRANWVEQPGSPRVSAPSTPGALPP